MKKEIKGLSENDVLKLRKKFGENSIEIKRKFSSMSLLVSQYKNVITLILAFAAGFSLLIGERIDSFFILLILFLNGGFGFIQEYRAEKTLEKLKDISPPLAHVIRNYREQEIDTRGIVPSDIVVLREGDKIPADGVLLSDIPLEVDEAILTGESLSVEKNTREPVYSGTFVVRGNGYMETKAIGFSTKLGQIAQELETTKKPKIPLAENLENLGRRFAIVALTLASLIFFLGIFQGREFKELILIAVSISVAMIPEGLPLVVTIALAVGAYRMAKRKTIVRKMSAIETLGATTVILSDKTGTITENKMRVKRHFLPNKEKLSLLLRACVLGNNASLAFEEDARLDSDSARQGGSFEVVGDPTDGAILLFAKSHVDDIEGFKTQGKITEEIPFDPATKLIQVLWENQAAKYVFARGAPESIIQLIKDNDKKELGKHLESYTKEGLRAIAFAYKKDGEKKFSLLSLFGIYDVPREEAKRAINEASSAGIRIVMVTGDNPVTAKSIAEEIKLINEGELVLTHNEIDKLSDEELIQLIPRIRIFARMVPADKLRLVRLYKRMGAVVAVTGDGVNDALALAEAHIGVAMGGAGTDVAKEASDIVITDDNLYTIVHAVEEGRGIFDNIIKVVVFLLSTNLTEFFVLFFSVLLGFPIPLSPTQILWINLVGDGAPALALATDSKRKNLLQKKPRNISEQILNFSRVRYILAIAFLFSILLMLFYIYILNNYETIPKMIIFNALVVGELIILFIIRGGVFPINRFLMASVIITLILQYFATTYLRDLF